MKILAAVVFGVVAWAQSGLDAPRLGVMLDAAGAARAVFGVAASVTIGDPLATGVVSLGCSAQVCWFKNDSQLVTTGATVAAPPGAAQFAFDPDTTFVYFPLSRQLAKLTYDRLEPVDLDVHGEILSMRCRKGRLEFAVRRADGVWIVAPGDQIVDFIGSDNGPLMLLKDGVLFTSEDAVILRREDGTELRFPVSGATAFFAMGGGYVQVRAGQSSWAIRVEVGREQPFLLPEGRP